MQGTGAEVYSARTFQNLDKHALHQRARVTS
jgi:hypothetical protein